MPTQILRTLDADLAHDVHGPLPAVAADGEYCFQLHRAAMGA
ncbi:hypothetical protein [Streptomyces sp. JNUCC 63]